MALKFPYSNGSGPLIQALEQLRKSFPQNVTAETLKKLGIASNNESYIINVINFLGIINEQGTKTEKASKIFSTHNDDEFSKSFSGLVKSAYKELFELHSEASWTLDKDKLTAFFRHSDQSSAVIGERQAKTFQALSTLAGYTKPSRPIKSSKPISKEIKSQKKTPIKSNHIDKPAIKETEDSNGRDIGLTVRIEINLPAQGDQETYDRIFQSIRNNFINAK